MKRWLTYSGLSIIIELNPLHWCWRPYARNERSLEWGMPDSQWVAGWLFLTIRLWIDDGSW